MNVQEVSLPARQNKPGGAPLSHPLFVPGRANPPGRGVGGLPVNPPPLAREFRSLLIFGNLVDPFASSGTLYAWLPGMGPILTIGGGGCR